MSLGRNDRCHCGSGKKYKKCCLLKDLEEAAEKEALGVAGMEGSGADEPRGLATWKILVIGTAVLGVIGLVLYLVGFPRLGGSVFGTGMLILIVFCAFRNEPAVRRRPGDAGNIDFGNRQ